MLKISFNAAVSNSFLPEDLVVDASQCISEVAAVIEAQKLMAIHGYDVVRLRYDSGEISLDSKEDGIAAAKRLYESNMWIYLPEGSDKSAPVLQARTKDGNTIYKCFKDAARLAVIEEKPIAFRLNGIWLQANPDMTEGQIHDQYKKKIILPRPEK